MHSFSSSLTHLSFGFFLNQAVASPPLLLTYLVLGFYLLSQLEIIPTNQLTHHHPSYILSLNAVSTSHWAHSRTYYPISSSQSTHSFLILLLPHWSARYIASSILLLRRLVGCNLFRGTYLIDIITLNYFSFDPSLVFFLFLISSLLFSLLFLIVFLFLFILLFQLF